MLLVSWDAATGQVGHHRYTGTATLLLASRLAVRRHSAAGVGQARP